MHDAMSIADILPSSYFDLIQMLALNRGTLDNMGMERRGKTKMTVWQIAHDKGSASRAVGIASGMKTH